MIPHLEALIALFVVFEAQKYVSSDEKKPYGWNKAVQMLKVAQILDTGVGENASEIMQSLVSAMQSSNIALCGKYFG